MNRARSFFYACLGILALAVAYHLGAQSAGAQAPGNPVVAVEPGIVYTANGDAYQRTGGPGPWTFVGNVFGSGGPTPTSQPTWGQVKAKYATPQGKAR
jgi:hypothetical protein